MATVLEFRNRFPQLVNVPEPIVDLALLDAQQIWDTGIPNWNAIVCYQAAHSITVQSIAMSDESELARSNMPSRMGARLSAGGCNLSDTQYGREVIRLSAVWVGGGLAVE